MLNPHFKQQQSSTLSSKLARKTKVQSHQNQNNNHINVTLRYKWDDKEQKQAQTIHSNYQLIVFNTFVCWWWFYRQLHSIFLNYLLISSYYSSNIIINNTHMEHISIFKLLFAFTEFLRSGETISCIPDLCPFVSVLFAFQFDWIHTNNKRVSIKCVWI